VIFVGDLALLQALADDVAERGVPLAPARLHGAACGFAIFPGEYYPYYELADLLDPGLAGDDPALERFVAAVREQLEAEDLAFTLLLPDDDAPIVDRLAALGLWCGGFLSAFGSGLGLSALGAGPGMTYGGDPADEGGFALPDEIQEVVDDLAAIADVEPESALDADSDPEEAEAQFMELEEFVKVAVLLMMSVLARGSADPYE
jgi:hypothetical protein